LTITAGVRVTDHALAVIGYQQPMARAVGVLLEPSAAVFASDLINIEGYRRGADPVVVDFRQPREFAELGRANAKVAHGQDYRPPIASSRAEPGAEPAIADSKRPPSVAGARVAVGWGARPLKPSRMRVQ
jgi:hypothetical protein